MKPFDLGRAKADDPFGVVKNIVGDIERVRLIGELTDGRIVVERHASSGVYYAEVVQEDQLRMLPTKRTIWINLHRQRDTGEIVSFLYDDEAFANRQRGQSMNCLGTFPIEIEE